MKFRLDFVAPVSSIGLCHGSSRDQFCVRARPSAATYENKVSRESLTWVS
jgi:hypothetical protein